MRTIPFTALLAAASLILSAAHAQPGERNPKTFEATKARAEQGDAPAQVNLGTCDLKGQGVDKDALEAVKWVRKSAEQNHAPAQSNPGVFHQEGLGVVAKDPVEAHAWYSLAAGSNEAASQSRDRLARRMSQGQLSDASRRTMKLRTQIQARLKSTGK